MLFNSFEFLFIFFPITLTGYFIFSYRLGRQPALVWLILASLCFYGYWNISFLPLILASILCNYAIGLNLVQCKNSVLRKNILIFGIALNLSALGYYKYSHFFISTINNWWFLNLTEIDPVLPLGISFFTFTQIAYLIDTYKRLCQEYKFTNYALFVTFFPHLLAGPILHHSEMMPQFAKRKTRVINYSNIMQGIILLSLGLAKKVIVADHLAAWANIGFADPGHLNLIEAWFVCFSYALQLYFDFSGYSDMAIGIAYFFNIRLPYNFDSPYQAVSLQDFWRRWHMTLSRFLRDYLYIPLGGNRGKNWKMHRNLLCTFILGGLWHGAGWTFVIWGMLHGMGLSIQKLWEKLSFPLPRRMAQIVTFLYVAIAWVFFRASSMSDAMTMLAKMIDVQHLESLKSVNIMMPTIFPFPGRVMISDAAWLIGALLLACVGKNSQYIAQHIQKNWFSAGLLSSLMVFSIISFAQSSEFLYFNF